MICVYLDTTNGFLGHQVMLGSTAAKFDLKFLWHYYFMFLAEKFIILSNHISGDCTPNDADKVLMRTLSLRAQVLDVQFEDYVIVGNGKYFSMSFCDGTACQCGHQEELHC
jgi:DNA repair protein RadC